MPVMTIGTVMRPPVMASLAVGEEPKMLLLSASDKRRFALRLSVLSNPIVPFAVV